jgi:hypothetical protein
LKLHDNFKVSIHKGGGSITYRHNSWPVEAQSENGGGKVCHGSGGIVPLLAE